MTPDTPSPRGGAAFLLKARQRRWRVGLAVLAALVLSSLAWYTGQVRQALEVNARLKTEVHARVLEGHVSRIFGAAANALRALAESPLVTVATLDSEAVERLLAQQVPGQPYLRSVSLLDDDGTVVASSHAPDVGARIPLASLGPAHVGDGRERPGSLLPVRHLGELAPGRAPPTTVAALTVARSVQAGSAPQRWLVLLLNVDYFATQHGLITRGEPIRALMLDLDGTLLSSTGDVALPAGAQLRELPLFERVRARQEQDFYIGTGSDAQRVAAAFRTTAQWPLLVLAEMPYAVVQAEWQSRVTAAAGLAAALLVLLAGLGWMADRGARLEFRALDQLETLNQEVTRTEERWKFALDGAGHGVWDIDLMTGRADVSAPRMYLASYLSGGCW